jgi:hypothetical protein
MSNITWQFQAAIPGGPAFNISQPPIAVQAYDVASVTVAAGASSVDVNVQPSSTTGDVTPSTHRTSCWAAARSAS